MNRYAELPELGSASDAEQRTAAQQLLKPYLDDRASMLCFVFGDGADADKAATIARATSNKAELCSVSYVIRVPDTRVLDEQQQSTWLAGNPRSVLLAFDRTVAVRLSSEDAQSSFAVLRAFTTACAKGHA